MRLYALVVLAVGLLVAADAADDAAEKELKKVQGAWRIVSVQRDEKEQKPENTVVTVSGDKFTTKSGEKVIREGTLKLNPSAKPKATDATYTAGPDKGKTLKGIYVLEDVTWKICYSGPGEERPKAFPEKDGKAYLLLVLKRDK